MKHTYLIIFCLFTFGILSAQEENLSKEEKARREKNIQAGNPFAKYGYKAKVATLSKGKYLEVHDLDSIVTIGTIRWNVNQNKIVGNIVQDTTDMYAQPIGDTAGRWLSPDPLSDEFPEWSPYSNSFNNPIFYIDPSGMIPIPAGSGMLVSDTKYLGTSDTSTGGFGVNVNAGNDESTSVYVEKNGNISGAAYQSKFKQMRNDLANLDLSLDGDDNGYDTDGNKVSNKGGNETDYLYDKQGNELASTKVNYRGISSGELSKGNLIKNPPQEGQFEYEGYGVRGWAMATGAITAHSPFFDMYAGGKTLGTIFNIAKVPLFKAIGESIRKYAPSLNRGAGLRVGISKANNINSNPGTRKVFRATFGNRAKHWFNIDLGKWGK